MVAPPFVFSVEPPNQIVQCQNTRIWWDKSTVQGTPNFFGIIPGGQSFSVPQGAITDVPAQGTGFTWKPSLRGGTTLILVGGDDRGNGTGGSVLNLVSSGFQNDISCLGDSSPSSTPGSPAGGSYPTGTGGWTSGGPSGGSGGSSGGGGSSSNVGAIVGGVLGGLALIIAGILLWWFFRRRQKVHKKYKERPVDLLNADEDDGDENARQRRNELPQYYQPEPFMVPDPTLRSSTGGEDEESSRPLSGGTSTSFWTRTGTPEPGSASVSGVGYGAGVSSSSAAGGGGRKGGMRAMRAVNIIQHDDAGPREEEGAKEEEAEAETIELPPAYTAVGKTRAAGGAGAGAGGEQGAAPGAGAGV
ncbi:hypothetical protein B0H34DRAFT_832083 [Crassisporium funariophilum]|nr:hypothetical protein B0H34DRAFT_832083 [Crassisporium funariophilum]